MVSANTEPPTLLTTRLAPLPPVAFITPSAKSPERVRMPASSPIAFSFSSFSAEPEVPITLAPSAFAVCSAATPTPAEMPVTSSHSPARSFPCDQHVVHHHEGERDASRLLPGEVLRHGDRLARVHERIFGERSGAASHDALARLEARDARPELGDLARALGAGGFRRAARLDAVPDDQLAAIQARRAHAHENLAGAGLGRRRVAQLDGGPPGIRPQPIRLHIVASLVFRACLRRRYRLFATSELITSAAPKSSTASGRAPCAKRTAKVAAGIRFNSSIVLSAPMR